MAEKVWVIEDPDELPRSRKTQRIERQAPPVDEKSPATAYSLSTLFWGTGQIYSGERTKGLVFLLIMVLVCAPAVLAAVFFLPLLQFLKARNISLSTLFLTAEIMLFCALFFWKYNAGSAYHGADKKRRTAFTGVQSKVCPFFCSLLVPGWGQFLNAQPLKGSIYAGFSIFSLFTLLTIPAVLLAWPSLNISDSRFVVEMIFALTVIFAPVIPVFWIIGGFDALKVSLDDLKKEPLLDRLKAANNRRRNQGWVRGVFPQIKWTILLVLFLVLLVTVLYYYYFPKNYYVEELARLQSYLEKQGMTLVPGLIEHLRVALTSEGR
jgi:TM2 domain-containing membrane protein YozV